MEVDEVNAFDGNGADETEILERAVGAERYSEHPIAEAITRFGDDGKFESTDFERHTRGVSATVEGERVAVGDESLFEEIGWETDTTDPDEKSVVVGWDGETKGVITLTDRPREGWYETIESLGGGSESKGCEIVVITGDSTAGDFDTHPCVDEVFTEVRPEAKVETVRRLRARGTTT
ncbi:MAG: HAD family hydrolase, partial [Halobacteria archaeon]|nr:HAD family hydrolase [Halobacteria archaeon]